MVQNVKNKFIKFLCDWFLIIGYTVFNFYHKLTLLYQKIKNKWQYHFLPTDIKKMIERSKRIK